MNNRGRGNASHKTRAYRRVTAMHYPWAHVWAKHRMYVLALRDLTCDASPIQYGILECALVDREIAFQFPGGNVHAVLVPSLALGFDVLRKQVIAQSGAHQIAALQFLNGFTK